MYKNTIEEYQVVIVLQCRAIHQKGTFYGISQVILGGNGPCKRLVNVLM